MTNPYDYNPYTTNPQTQYEPLKEPQEPPLDPYSIAGLASSLFCPPAGLVLSIIGYNNTKDNAKRYKTIAIIGLVFSILGTIQLAFDFEFTTATLITWIIAAIFIAISFIAVNSVNEKSKHTTPSGPTIPLTGNPEIDRWNQVAQSIPGYSPEYAERIDPVKQPLRLDLPTKYIRVQQFMDKHVPADQRANPYINPPSRDLATSVYGLERYAQGSRHGILVLASRSLTKPCKPSLTISTIHGSKDSQCSAANPWTTPTSKRHRASSKQYTILIQP